MLGTSLIGREIEELMADFGAVSRQLAQDPQLGWLGPHKGVVHLALASLTNACFDLWAKTRGLPCGVFFLISLHGRLSIRLM
jgi:L-fuconate dehydratase